MRTKNINWQKLRQTDLRYQSDISADCDLYSRVDRDQKRVNQKLAAQRQSNEQEIAETFERYGECLNKYLNAFGAGFRIIQLEQTRRGAVLRVDYKIGLPIAGSSHKRIPLTVRGNDVSEQSFRNVLSEGDKRTLALAFFLAQLDERPDLPGLIVVFDDPVSSLDENRQLYTSEVIGETSRNAKQTIVLSHRPDFLYRVYDHYGRGPNTPCLANSWRSG